MAHDVRTPARIPAGLVLLIQQTKRIADRAMAVALVALAGAVAAWTTVLWLLGADAWR